MGEECEEYEESFDLGKRMLPVDRGLVAGGDFLVVGLNKGATTQDFCENSVVKTGRGGSLRMGVGAPIITESGVSVRVTTGKMRSGSVESENGSRMFVSLIDSIPCLEMRPYGERGG